MGLKGVISLRFTCVLMFLLCVLPPMVKTQISGCSVEGIDLGQCLSQGHNSTDSCCKALKQAVQVGFHCLCTLLASSSTPLLATPLALPLSNCYISMPPLALCQVPGGLPPSDGQMEPSQPSGPEHVFKPMPPHGVPVPLNSTQDINMNSTQDFNVTVATMQARLSGDVVPKLNMSDRKYEICFGGEKTKNLFSRSLLLSVVLFACIL